MAILSTATTIKKAEAVALGGFDGMHLGHQELFKRLGKKGAIVVIENGYSTLTPDGVRERHTSYPILYLDLEKIKHLEADAFIELLHDHFPHLKKIVVGYDFHFGKDRKYSAAYLKKVCSAEVEIVDEVKIEGISVHSRHIRELIRQGDIKLANRLLGYNYTMIGRLEKGQGIGAKELVATINLHTESFEMPKEGVYATLTRIDDEEYYHPSVSFIGHRVTTDGSFAIESHILDGDVKCQKKVEISFVDFLRENRKFDTLQELKEQIQKDIKMAQKELKMLAL